PHPRAWLFGGSKEGQLDAPLVRDDGAQRLHPGQPTLGEAGSNLVGFAIELFDLRADPNCPALTGGSRGDEHRRPPYVLSLSVPPLAPADREGDFSGELGDRICIQRRIELEPGELCFQSAGLWI